jgi:predicted nucleic acid-binding protein
MTVQAFVDSNVIIYAASSRPSEKVKKAKATELIAETEFGVSAQVLAETYAILTTKGEPPLNPELALAWIELLEQQPCVAIDAGLVKRGAAISARYQISYWDGAILAAAEALGAEVVYSEDLNHGQAYGSVKVVNPFK